MSRRLLTTAAAVALLTAAPASASGPRGQWPRRYGPRNQSSHHRQRHHRGGCAHADTPAISAPKQEMKTAVVCLINQQRARFGLPTLQEDTRLDRSAQGWTVQMVVQGLFSHGTDFASRIAAAGLNWVAAGENIATGYPTPRAVVSAWMASPDHCQNILNPTYSAVGTGVVRRAVGGWAPGPATWTQDFALPAGVGTPSSNWGPDNGCPY